VVWVALAEAVVVVAEDAPVLAQAEPVQSCGVTSLRDSDAIRGSSFNHLIRPRKQRPRDGEAERLGGLEVDHHLELRRLLDG
jgi:hypothetical protein